MKYRSMGNEKVEKALARLNAKKLSTVTMEDIYFAHPSRDFAKTDEALKLRKKDDGAELTFKGPRLKMDSTKAREEITMNLDNPLAAQRILERLGFKETYTVRKRRTSYLLDKLRVDLDEVEGLGEFVELEVLTESPERAEELLKLAKADLDLGKLEPKTYLELQLDKTKS